jgi:hypothetical protein
MLPLKQAVDETVEQNLSGEGVDLPPPLLCKEVRNV